VGALLRCVQLLALALTAACGRLGFGEAAPVDAQHDAPDAPTGPVPIHVYQLDGTYADDLGGPALVGRGGSFVPGGYQFAVNQGLALTSAMPAEVYTVDMVFSFDTLGSWRKILDFKNLRSDNGLYTYDNSLQFVVVAGSTFETSPPVLAANTTMQVTLTRNAAGRVTGYVNRAQLITFVDTSTVAALGSDAIANFFIDDTPTGGGESSGGIVRRIRIYDVALDATQLPL